MLVFARWDGRSGLNTVFHGYRLYNRYRYWMAYPLINGRKKLKIYPADNGRCDPNTRTIILKRGALLIWDTEAQRFYQDLKYLE